MKLRTWGAAAAALVLVAAACAKPPVRELEASREQARVAIQETEAQVFAPEAARTVQDSIAAVEAAIAAQSRRLPFLRKYDAALERLEGVTAALDDMRRQASLGKETMRTEAASRIQEAAALADSAESESQSTPAVKGGRVLVGMIRTELALVRDQIEQARASLAAEQVAVAHEQAAGARDRARQLLDEIRSSRSKVQALRARQSG